MKKFLALFLFLISWSALALTDVDKQDMVFKNYYGANSGFEQGLKDVTVSGATKALSAAVVHTGKRALQCHFTAATQYCETKLVTIPGDTLSAVARAFYRTTSANIKMEVLDSSNNVINGIFNLPATIDYKPSDVSYSSITATAYKIRFTETAAETADLYVDDIVQSENFLVGTTAVITDWQSWTPTSTCSTNITWTGKWRQVGDTAEISFLGTFGGTNTQGACELSMPTGLVINTSKILGADHTGRIEGVISVRDANGPATGELPGIVKVKDANTVQFAVSDDATGSDKFAVSINTSTNSPITFAAGDTIKGYFRVPIVGWSTAIAVQSNQANPFGVVTWSNITNCDFYTTGGILADADCNTGAVIPSGSVTSGNDNYQLTAYNLKAGSVYKISATGSFRSVFNTTATSCNFQIYDGTTYSGNARSFVGTSTQDVEHVDSVTGYFTYSSFQPSKTFSVYATRTGGGGDCQCTASDVGRGCSIAIEEVYPNAQAPQLLRPAGDLTGLKEYDCTVTGTNFTQAGCKAVVYRTMDSTGAYNTWRMKYNLTGNVSGSPTGITLTFANVTFRNIVNHYQSVTCSATSTQGYGYTSPNASTIDCGFATGVSRVLSSGDVELESKPNWAY